MLQAAALTRASWRQEREELEQSSADRPQAREAQRALAEPMTTMIHGETECDRARSASAALFSGAVKELDATMRR